MFRNLFMTCPDVALKLGDSVRVVEHWVKGFEDNGFSALSDKPRPGRPTRLTEKHLTKISGILRKQPKDVGLSGNLWDGKTLSAYIQQEFSVALKVRQCQRLFHKLSFRWRKPRHQIAHGDPMLQGEDFAHCEEGFDLADGVELGRVEHGHHGKSVFP